MSFWQMMEKFEGTLAAMEGNIGRRLLRIEQRLESLESVVSWEKVKLITCFSCMIATETNCFGLRPVVLKITVHCQVQFMSKFAAFTQ